MDPRYKKLAKIFVNYSTDVQKGELVIIHCFDGVPDLMIKAIIDEVCKRGGIPMVWLEKYRIIREILKNGTKEIIKAHAEHELKTMQKAKAYIVIRSYENDNELSDVPADKMDIYKKYWLDPVHFKERILNTKWVLSRWPTKAMAQKFGTSTEAMEDWFFKVCADVDYKAMDKNMDPLVKLMKKTDKVKIVGPGDTYLEFSIKGIPVRKCPGERNIPDGEIFTAPAKNSVNGIIEYNTPTMNEGKKFSNIKLKFKDGKIIESSCESGDQKALENILNTDKGARYIGEFALGVNPQIKESMGEILFDEKIAGSFHFTPGNAYDDADNGNKSNIHWDLVCIQTKEKGGGEMYFDDVLVRKDGMFVLKELKKLNP